MPVSHASVSIMKSRFESGKASMGDVVSMVFNSLKATSLVEFHSNNYPLSINLYKGSSIAAKSGMNLV